MSKKPSHIGKYEVLRVIGEGGMGIVYHCMDPDLKRLVAVKVLTSRKRRNSMEGLRRRFLREALTTAQLQHPGIPPVHEVGRTENRQIYYAMKHIDGKSLSAILNDLRDHRGDMRQKFDTFRMIEVLLDVSRTLQYAHSRGYIHRDLKPSNIFVGDYGEVYIIDWGLTKRVHETSGRNIDFAKISRIEDIAKVYSALEENEEAITRTMLIEEVEFLKKKGFQETSITQMPESDDDEIFDEGDYDKQTLTLQGNVMGTLSYMPPEQALGKTQNLGREVDVFALGVILYELLTLELPIEGNDFTKVLEAKVKGDFVPPEYRATDRDVPPELSAIAMQAMSPNPSDRYPSAKEFSEALEFWLEGKTQYRQINKTNLAETEFYSLPADSRSAWQVGDNVIRSLEWAGDKPSYLVFRKEIIGDIRVSVNLIAYPINESGQSISQLAIIPRGLISQPWKGFVDGLQVNLGAGHNTRATIERHDSEIQSNEYIMLEPRRRYNLTVEQSAEGLRVLLNGQIILFHQENYSQEGVHLCLVHKGAGIQYSDFKIRVRGLPSQVPAISIPEAFMAENQYEAALKRFLAIAQGNRNRQQGAWACHRAGIASYMANRNRSKAMKIWEPLKKSSYAVFEQLGRVMLEILDDRPEKAIAFMETILSKQGPIPYIDPVADIVFEQAQQSFREAPETLEQWRIVDGWSRLALKLGSRLENRKNMTPSILWRWLLLALTRFPERLSGCILFLQRIFGKGHGAFAEILTTIEPLMNILKRSSAMSDHSFLVDKVMRLILNHDDNLGNLETLFRFYLHSGHLEIARRLSTHICNLCIKHQCVIPPAPIAYLACMAWVRQDANAQELIHLMMNSSSEWAKPDGCLLMGLEHYRHGRKTTAESYWSRILEDPSAVSFNRHLVAQGMLGTLPPDPVKAQVPNRSDHRLLYCLYLGFKHYADWCKNGDGKSKKTSVSLFRNALALMQPSYDIYSATDMFARIPLDNMSYELPSKPKPEPLSEAEVEWVRQLTKAASDIHEDNPRRPSSSGNTKRRKTR